MISGDLLDNLSENSPDNLSLVVPGKPGTHGGAQSWARTTSTTPNRKALFS